MSFEKEFSDLSGYATATMHTIPPDEQAVRQQLEIIGRAICFTADRIAAIDVSLRAIMDRLGVPKNGG